MYGDCVKRFVPPKRKSCPLDQSSFGMGHGEAEIKGGGRIAYFYCDEGWSRVPDVGYAMCKVRKTRFNTFLAFVSFVDLTFFVALQIKSIKNIKGCKLLVIQQTPSLGTTILSKCVFPLFPRLARGAAPSPTA